MGSVSVAQAAQRLGVSVARIHQRIADGSVSAERIGAQWVVDERSLLHVQERSKAGRPLSARSAWAVIAESEANRDSSALRAPAASSRAQKQLAGVLDVAAQPVESEEAVNQLVIVLRSMFRNRAQRRLLRAAPADLADLRADPRWALLVDLGASGIASADVEGYVEEADLERLVKDHLLVESDRAANVVLHLIPEGQNPFPDSRLRLAADLAEHRRPREEARAAQLVHDLASEWKEAER